ncbi:MAG: six-cysteine ranthipeptide SCIFF [Firmicutes bacterium]|nr:six-cysteine ranthipeptide SCIFF [Bacillota bacterium]
MKHIKIVAKNRIKRDKLTGCGECAAACQSACKTSCTVGNVECERITHSLERKTKEG